MNLDESIKELSNGPKDSKGKLINEKDQNKYEGLIKIRDLMASNQFLLRSHSGENGVIKQQIHFKELAMIIENLKKFPKYKEFFEFKDPYGDSNEEKIKSIFHFKIPYYIGPLDNNAGNKNSWAKNFKKKDAQGQENKKIYPWNWYKKIDKDKAAEEFIKRMINYCTYLMGEKVLPANSLVYEEYKLLNEINKFKIAIGKQEPIYLNQSQKNDLIEEYKREGHLTKKQLDLFAKKETNNNDAYMEIPHQDGEKDSYFLQATLNSYKDFKEILGKDIDGKTEEMVEQMILTLTLFEDINIRAKRIREISNDYGFNLSESQFKKIINKRYKGWGKYCKKLLCDTCVFKDDKPLSILGAMKAVYKDENGNDYSMNFMEVINDDDLGFNRILEQYKEDYVEKKGYSGYKSYIEESYSSPMMKRATIQAMSIIKEVQKLLGDRRIDCYFLETTRSPDQSKTGKNGNKFSRYNEIETLYEKISKKINDSIFKTEGLKKMEGNLNNLKNLKEKSSLRSKKIFLYFLQMGKDVYTGKTIDFDQLINRDGIWDIDHIIPQSMVKDDSINNIVLVSNVKNQTDKRNIYPIPEGTIEPEGKKVIEALHSMGLMSGEKYWRLTRKSELTDKERLTFINRQLVSTSQSVKALRDVILYDERQRLMEKYRLNHEDYDEKKIEKGLPMVLYPKASITSDFRRDFDIFKCRETNDWHHAHDAYLNIVTGACYFAKFGQKATIERLKQLKENHSTINSNKIFFSDIYYLNAKNKSDKYVWIAQDSKSGLKPTISNIKEQLKNKDVLFTYRLHQGEGDLFNQTIISPKNIADKKDLSGYTSLKGSSNKDKRMAELSKIEKYGYYNNATINYLCLVESEGKNGKKEYSFVSVPNLAKGLNKDGQTKEEEFFNSSGKKNMKVIIPKLLYGTVCEYFDPSDKKKVSRFMIRAKTGDRNAITNLKEAYFPANITYFCKLIAKYNLANALAGKNGKATGYKKDNDEIIFSQNEKDNKPMDLENPSYQNQDQIINKAVTKMVYEYITKQINKPIYFIYGKYKDFYNDLVEKEDEFNNLEIEKQITLINSLLTLIQCKPNAGCDLTLIGESAHSGTLNISSSIKPNFRIITQSPTGFYEKVIFELDSKGKRKI